MPFNLTKIGNSRKFSSIKPPGASSSFSSNSFSSRQSHTEEEQKPPPPSHPPTIDTTMKTANLKPIVGYGKVRAPRAATPEVNLPLEPTTPLKPTSTSVSFVSRGRRTTEFNTIQPPSRPTMTSTPLKLQEISQTVESTSDYDERNQTDVVTTMSSNMAEMTLNEHDDSDGLIEKKREAEAHDVEQEPVLKSSQSLLLCQMHEIDQNTTMNMSTEQSFTSLTAESTTEDYFEQIQDWNDYSSIFS